MDLSDDRPSPNHARSHFSRPGIASYRARGSERNGVGGGGKTKMKGDYKICRGWGNRIEWSNPREFEGGLNGKTFRVNGHQAIIPSVGNTLVAEFQKSFIKFEFVEVQPCGDPPDMFFARVKPIEQEMK